MYTSLVLVALSSFPAVPPETNSLTWQCDYVQANQQGQSEQKPLAIFVGKGKNGHEKLVKKGKLTPQMQKLLAEKYVCVYADTKKKTGQ